MTLVVLRCTDFVKRKKVEVVSFDCRSNRKVISRSDRLQNIPKSESTHSPPSGAALPVLRSESSIIVVSIGVFGVFSQRIVRLVSIDRWCPRSDEVQCRGWSRLGMLIDVS